MQYTRTVGTYYNRLSARKAQHTNVFHHLGHIGKSSEPWEGLARSVGLPRACRGTENAIVVNERNEACELSDETLVCCGGVHGRGT